MGQWLSEKLGQSFVIENRPGGGTNIATEQVLRATPDGYTLLLVAPANAINATLYDKLPFDFIKEMEPIAGIIRFPNVVVVHPSLPIKTIPELIAYAKANPGKLNMASSGNGSTIHMSGELFKMITGINMVHVPYRGGAPALTDMLSGQMQVMFDNIPTCAEHVKSGKLRGLAVTSTVRSEVLPDLPLVADFLPGYEASAWYGLAAPKGTPPSDIHSAIYDAKRHRVVALAEQVIPGRCPRRRSERTPRGSALQDCALRNASLEPARPMARRCPASSCETRARGACARPVRGSRTAPCPPAEFPTSTRWLMPAPAISARWAFR